METPTKEDDTEDQTKKIPANKAVASFLSSTPKSSRSGSHFSHRRLLVSDGKGSPSLHVKQETPGTFREQEQLDRNYFLAHCTNSR